MDEIKVLIKQWEKDLKELTKKAKAPTIFGHHMKHVDQANELRKRLDQLKQAVKRSKT